MKKFMDNDFLLQTETAKTLYHNHAVNMPIYDYHCKACGDKFELLILKGTVAACPACKSKKIEQQISTFAVSSQDMTRANVAKARAKYKGSKELKDKQVHEAEEIKEHYEHGH